VPTCCYRMMRHGSLLGLDPKQMKDKTPPRALKQPLGYGVAVSPRTERIEPPLILGSGTTKSGKEWQAGRTVARRG